MNNKNVTIILIIILAVTVFLNLNMMNEINNLENMISNINQNYRHLDGRISGINNSVQNTLNEFNKENMWIRNHEIQIVEYYPKAEAVDVEISIEFNELKNEEALTLLVVDSSNNKIPYKMEGYQDTLVYNDKIRLDSNKDYSFSVVAGNDVSKRSTDVDNLNVKSTIENLVVMENWVHRSSANSEGEIQNFHFNLFIYKNVERYSVFEEFVKGIEIVDITGELYVDGTLLDTLDFINGDNWEELEVRSEGEREPAVRETKPDTKVILDIDGVYNFDEEISYEMSDIVLVVKAEDSNGRVYTQDVPVTRH
jgi:hypothetical protein